ncbi:hypothetical protein HY988_04845 [Candidatus Micrarchaeota archaeon]|nr:hypothetical protein [Candidatus Micrarchaeota archaeon]
MALNLGIKDIEKKLFEDEKNLDTVMAENRKIVRCCSNAIKAMHSHDLVEGKKSLKEAKEGLDKLVKLQEDFPAHLDHVFQEYSEACIVLSVIEQKKIPGYKELKVPAIPYILGLLDSIGELKREMYESLRKNKRKEAEKYFELMEAIYDELLPLRFSNSVLPDFRRKQDVGRIQIEQARGELL